MFGCVGSHGEAFASSLRELCSLRLLCRLPTVGGPGCSQTPIRRFPRYPFPNSACLGYFNH